MQTKIIDPSAFPLGFQTFLQNNALPFPPLPQTLLPFFKETDYNFFGTTAYCPEKNLLFLEDLKKTKTPINTLSTGIIGSSLQSRYAVYFLHLEQLLLGISLGWNRIYADAEFERTELEQAYKIAKICILNMPEQGELAVLVNENGCTWQYSNGENVNQGENLASLLDFIEQQSPENFELPHHLWIRV